MIYQLTIDYIDEDSGRWQTRTLAFSKSVETLKAKAVERKDIWDQRWKYDDDDGTFYLVVNTEEMYNITPITLI